MKHPVRNLGLLLPVALLASCVVMAESYPDGLAETRLATGGLVCDVRLYGAYPGDETDDTAGIQTAVDDCKGKGGKVLLEGGRYLAGSIELGSHMTFAIAAGSRLSAIPDIERFPLRKDVSATGNAGALSGDGYSEYRAFLYASKATGLTIEGPGMLDGQGPLFWDPGFIEGSQPRPSLPRPQQMIELVDGTDLTVRDLTLVDAPAYSIRFYRSDRVRAENIKIRNHPRSPNTDGIQIRDTSNAIIRGADINTGDDAIVIKSYARMVENVIVTDSILTSDDSAIKFGTAGYTGVRNSLFSNIIIRDSRYGIALFQMDGGLYQYNRFHNIQVETGGRWPRTYAVYVDVDRRREDSPWGRIEGLTFSEIESFSGGNWLIAGNGKSKIRDLTLRNVSLRLPERIADLSATVRKPRGNTLLTPNADSEDYSKVQAHFALANIAGLTVDGLTIDALAVQQSAGSGERDGLWLKRVSDGMVDGVVLRSSVASGLPVVRTEESPGVQVSGVRLTSTSPTRPLVVRQD